MALRLGTGGGQPPDTKDGETGTQAERLQGRGHQGVTVASLLVEGAAPSGEAKKELRQAIEASARIAESDLDNQRIPASLRRVAAEYFDRIQGRTDD